MITKIIKTNYGHINHIKKIISDKKFIYDIIEIINPISYQVINDNRSWPKIIKYQDKPKFIGSYFSLPEVTIIQEWDLKDNRLSGIIYSYYNNKHLFTVKFECNMKVINIVYLETKCHWEFKQFFIPNNMIHNIMNSLEDIITKILKSN